MKRVFLFALVSVSLASTAQVTKRVLFLGNSLTYVNNLPQMIADAALSTGDILIFDSYCPGGYKLYQHYADVNTRNKIMMGNWDYVVLQDQSLLPATDTASVNFAVFPYAFKLDSMINQYNPCCETMFYMTWGYKNGCAGCFSSWPYVETYEGMDSLLNLRYRMMADSNHAVVSPVGAVWHYIRDNFPLIDLYQADEIHPSVAGTYAGACSFYSALFRKDPALITFNASLSPGDALNIRNSAKVVVYDSLLNWNVGLYDVVSDFSYAYLSGNTFQFTNLSQNATAQLWDFGTDTDTSANPVHTFPGTGPYTVQLISFTACDTDTFTQVISASGIAEYNSAQLHMYANPASDELIIEGPSLNGRAELEIFNLSGERILNTPLNAKAHRVILDATRMNNGVYFIRIKCNAFAATKKFVVQR